MSTVQLLPSANLSPRGLAARLHRPPQVVARPDRDLPAILSELWESTETRARRPARPWARPDSPPWIEAALREFAADLLGAFRGTGSDLVLTSAVSADGLATLQRLVPDIPLVQVIRDGRGAPKPLASPQEGLAWARQWAASVAPGQEAGLDAITIASLRPGALAGTVLAPLAAAHWPALQPLRGEALLGFLCWAPARQALEAAGFGQQPAPPQALSDPELIAAVAENEPVEQAVQRLNGAVRRVPAPRLWALLGDKLSELGDDDRACGAWREALRLAPRQPSALVALLSRPERDDAMPHIQSACAHGSGEVRAAAARWLVGRGMDEESAEALTQVRDQRWYAT